MATKGSKNSRPRSTEARSDDVRLRVSKVDDGEEAVVSERERRGRAARLHSLVLSDLLALLLFLSSVLLLQSACSDCDGKDEDEDG